MTTAIAREQNGNSPLSFGSFVDNIFQTSLRRYLDDSWDADSLSTSASVPVNVRETDHQYEMDVIAPGCKKEDFAINVENNILTISFNRKEHTEPEGWVRNEYIVKSFTRSFTLDDTVNVNFIGASYKEGVLRLVLPKNEKAQRLVKNIEIK